MNEPNFIITRFTHGSAGKFLSTVLQTSDRIDHWSADVQNNKDNFSILNQIVLQHVSRSFPADHSTHLRSEPMVPYNVDLYSVGLPRGNEVTLNQYLEYAHKKQDTRLLQAIANKLIINLVFSKPRVPEFCNGSNVVTITVTTENEKGWLYKTLWSKHFLETNDTIRYLPSDPDYCNYRSLASVLTFNNTYLFNKQEKDKLYKKYVVNNHTNYWYFNPKMFNSFDTKHKLNNYFVRLDEILSVDKFLNTIERVFNNFNLGQPNIPLIMNMHQIWLSRQISYDYC